MLDCRRRDFELSPEALYLNCAYLSPLLRSSVERGQEAILRKAHPWGVGLEEFFGEVEKYRSLVAHLIQADPNCIAVVPSVSYGISVAAKNLPLKAGQKIILLQDQFPSNVYVWMERAKEVRAEILTVARPEDWDWTAAVLTAMDSSTAVVALPHAHWMDGSLVDLIAIGERCRELGAALVVDGTQSVGAVSFDVAAVKPAFLCCAGYKWQLGPYGLGFLYVDPQYHEGTPLEFNWINRERAEDFASLVHYREGYAKGARRFDMGEKSNFILLPMAISALETIQSWTVGEIEKYLRVLTDLIAEHAEDRGYGTIPQAHRGPHMTGISLTGAPEDLVSRLAQKSVHVSRRGETLRISPYLYNATQDIPRFFDVLDGELKSS